MFFLNICTKIKEVLFMKICLPATEKIPTSSYFGISLPLSVIVSTPETEAWFYENLINIYIEERGNICFTDLCFGVFARYNSVFDYTISTQEDTKGRSIVDRIKYEMRENGNYAYLYVDEYYISCKNAYGKYHFHHQALIYGYDDEEKCLLAIAFDETGHFAKLKYPYDETEKGYEAAFSCDEEDKSETYGVMFFKVKEKFAHRIFLPNVITALQEYVNGTIPRNMRFLQHNMASAEFYQSQGAVYGMSVLKKVCELFDELDLSRLTFPVFRRVHFLYEHSQMLLDRLHYFRSFADSEDEVYEATVSEYAEIVWQYQKARMLYMKMELIQNQSESVSSYALKIIENIKAIYSEIYPKEKEILTRVLHCMREWNAFRAPGKEMLSYELTERLSVQTKMTAHEKICTFTFEKSMPVNVFSFFTCEDMRLYIDGELYDSYCFTGLPVSGNVEVPVNRWIHEISFHFEADSSVVAKNIDLKVYGGNVFLQAQTDASSVWTDDDGSASPATHSSEKALIGNERIYWRAAVQKHTYDGKDWFSIKMREPGRINCIDISELTYSPRLKRYKIFYTDTSGKECELLTYHTDGSCRYIHRFPAITFTGIRIVFLECFSDALDYTEPIVSCVQGYCLEQEKQEEI